MNMFTCAKVSIMNNTCVAMKTIVLLRKENSVVVKFVTLTRI